MEKVNQDYSQRRLNIILPERTVERISNIKEMTLSSSVTDVIRTAVLTYEALVKFMSEGNRFYIKRDGEENLTPVEFVLDVKVKKA